MLAEKGVLAGVLAKVLARTFLFGEWRNRTFASTLASSTLASTPAGTFPDFLYCERERETDSEKERKIAPMLLPSALLGPPSCIHREELLRKGQTWNN